MRWFRRFRKKYPVQYVTPAMVGALGPCRSQLDLFSYLFPHGTRVTGKNVERARRAGLDVAWLVFGYGRQLHDRLFYLRYMQRTSRAVYRRDWEEVAYITNMVILKYQAQR